MNLFIFSLSICFIVVTHCVRIKSRDSRHAILSGTRQHFFSKVNSRNDPGIFENCGKSSFNLTWTPNPIIMTEQIELRGYFIFPKDFTNGTVELLVPHRAPLKGGVRCKNVVHEGLCTEGRKIDVQVSYRMPLLPYEIKDQEVKVEIKDDTGYVLLCAKATLSFIRPPKIAKTNGNGRNDLLHYKLDQMIGLEEKNIVEKE